jgi:hypothetical protein
MMSHRTSYCHKGRPRKQCVPPKIPKNKCLRRARCLKWQFRVANDVGDITHRHVMQSPHQQQWMIRQKPRIPCHLKRVHATPHVSKGTNEKNVVVALPAKNLLAWHPGAAHVSLHGHYKTPCFMWRHIKTCWNSPYFHMSKERFSPVWHDGF